MIKAKLEPLETFARTIHNSNEPISIEYNETEKFELFNHANIFNDGIENLLLI